MNITKQFGYNEFFGYRREFENKNSDIFKTLNLAIDLLISNEKANRLNTAYFEAINICRLLETGTAFVMFANLLKFINYLQSIVYNDISKIRTHEIKYLSNVKFIPLRHGDYDIVVRDSTRTWQY
jgi:hypothetical protein